MKLSKSQVNKYNKLADKGKNVMIDTDRYGTVAWEDGDYGHKSIIASDDDGKEVEIDFNNVVRVNEAKTVKLTRSKLKEMVKEEILKEAKKDSFAQKTEKILRSIKLKYKASKNKDGDKVLELNDGRDLTFADDGVMVDDYDNSNMDKWPYPAKRHGYKEKPDPNASWNDLVVVPYNHWAEEYDDYLNKADLDL